jgi:hypothetical protein
MDPAMSIALCAATMTREQFLDRAEAQGERYQFDRFVPVAMTGGNVNHSQIGQNTRFASRRPYRGP